MKYVEKTIIEHLCEDCEMPVGDCDGMPHYVDGNGDFYCLDCALKRHFIDAEYWLNCHGMNIYDHALYKNGKIIMYRKWGKRYQKNIIDPFGKTE